MKKIVFTIFMLCLVVIQSIACPVCERNKTNIFKGLVHGNGPNGFTDYFIVALITLIAVATLYFSIKKIIKPGEQEADHIKRFIINSKGYERKK